MLRQSFRACRRASRRGQPAPSASWRPPRRASGVGASARRPAARRRASGCPCARFPSPLHRGAGRTAPPPAGPGRAPCGRAAPRRLPLGPHRVRRESSDASPARPSPATRAWESNRGTLAAPGHRCRRKGHGRATRRVAPSSTGASPACAACPPPCERSPRAPEARPPVVHHLRGTSPRPWPRCPATTAGSRVPRRASGRWRTNHRTPWPPDSAPPTTRPRSGTPWPSPARLPHDPRARASRGTEPSA